MERSPRQQRITDRIFPFLAWLKTYKAAYIKNDAVAGLTVAVVLIPQAMAYAMLAGLPPVYGLYAGAVTPLIGALWGSLRQLATGPIAIMSLLVLTTLTPIAEPGSREFIELSFLLAFLVGVIYLLIGFFRFGFIMAFISHSAVKGFTSAASLIIISTQLPHLFGIQIERHEYMFPKLLAIIQGIPGLHLPTLGIGLLAMGIIYGIKKFKPTFPAALVALVVTTLLVYGLKLTKSGVAIVGKSQGGLPMPALPPFDFDMLFYLIGPAVVLALVSFAETYSVGKSISADTKQKLDVDQEFIGQGFANLVGSFFQCYPVSGSFSRTAINFASGARTGISSVITTCSVIIALLFLTPLLTHIPKAALAALVITAVLMLFHPREVFRLWKMNRHDGIVAICVFTLALIAKPDYALMIGILMSLVFFLWKTMHPRIVRIAKDPELNMFVNADVFKKPGCPQILHLRSDNSIYFANAEYTIEHIIERLGEIDTPAKFLLLDLQAMAFIDITGIDELRVLQEEVQIRKMELALMETHRPVIEVMKSSGFLTEMNPEFMLQKRGEAITTLFKHIDHDYCKNVCPHTLFFECKTVK
jgi:SulP family sulfate permease